METTPSFELTPKQVEANRLLGGPARHILLRGGSRSGKTFLLCRAIVIRALKAAGSTHAIMRYRFNHIKGSIIYDTLPAVMQCCFPHVPYVLNKSDWFAELPNGSRIWFGGLDDKERTEKVLGQEHSTIFLNECSQISYDARNKMLTRLAQKNSLALRAYYDCNPPSVGHWTYLLFEKRLEPRSGEALAHPDNYTSMRINPVDNVQHLGDGYMAELEALPERDRRRFLHGDYLAQVAGALWTPDLLDRVRKPTLNTEAEREAAIVRMQRIVVAVDPSGCQGEEDERSDEIGIVVCGRDHHGCGYVLEDLTGRYSPEQWARTAVEAFGRWRADRIVAEVNYGGAMVTNTLRTIQPGLPVRVVTASRAKHQRAEPIASLYEQGKVGHCGRFPDLEDQLCNFSFAGYQGSKSPDRADAAIWGLTDLMLTARSPKIIAPFVTGGLRNVPGGMIDPIAHDPAKRPSV